MNVQLLIIDPQCDFCIPPNDELRKWYEAQGLDPKCDPKCAGGSLLVPGAYDDMKRAATMINRIKNKIDDIHLTLDSHNVIDIGHSGYWINSKGEHPGVFTPITLDDLKNGTWMTFDPARRAKSILYAEELKAKGKYGIMVWTEHCVIGTWGHSIVPELADAVNGWARDSYATVDFCVKGSNPHTEHYSAFQAEVVDNADLSTMPNKDLANIIVKGDMIITMGEALSHCLAYTLRDIVAFLGKEHAKKFWLVTDCTSSVGGFEKNGDDFIKEMVALGMNTCKSTEILS